MAARLGFANGEYVQLLYEVKQILANGPRNLEMNVAALDAALCADQGFNEVEFYYFMSLSFSAGLIFCSIDAKDHKEGEFLPFRCKAVSYSGEKYRVW